MTTFYGGFTENSVYLRFLAKLAYGKPLVCLKTTAKKVVKIGLMTRFMTVMSYGHDGKSPRIVTQGIPAISFSI